MAPLLIVLGLAYPLLVYVGLGTFDARQLALLIVATLVIRTAVSTRERFRDWLRASGLPVASVGLVALITAAWNEPRMLLLVPALVNAALLLSFAGSLMGESVVERIARLQAGDLPAAESSYCRSVTLLWCGFFGVNGLIALRLAVVGSMEQWALYTGLIAYILMGALFAAELTYRHWRFRRYVGGVADPLFRRIFPPKVVVQPPQDARPQAPLRMGSQSDAAWSREPDFGNPRLAPEVLAERRTSDLLELDLRVPQDLACWPGHFPRQFIVPGVVQLQWVADALAHWTGEAPSMSQIDALKFKTPLLPGYALRLRIERDPVRHRYSFEFSDGDAVFSKGRIELAGDGARS